MTAEAKPPAGREIRVGLLWHSANSANLGVGALTLGNMAIARQVAQELGLSLHFTIIGVRGNGPSCLTEGEAELVDVDFRTLLGPGGCWAIIGALDCLLDIGAGDSFADIHGNTRFFFLLMSKMIAAARRTPQLLSPQTIGPFTRTPFKQLAGLAMDRAYAVVARDQPSLEAVAELAPRAHGVLSTDVAMALPYEDKSALRGGSPARVGVNVSGLLWDEAVSGVNRYGLTANYAELMNRLLAALVERGAEVHLITHVASDRPVADNDSPVADRLATEFSSAIRVPNFAGPCEAKSYISGLDFLVAGRMHACIAAFSSGVPVVPIAYSRKFEGLFDLVGYPWRVPVRGLSTDQALAYVVDCFDRRGQLAEDVRVGMTKVEALLDAYRAELRRFFGSVAATRFEHISGITSQAG